MGSCNVVPLRLGVRTRRARDSEGNRIGSVCVVRVRGILLGAGRAVAEIPIPAINTSRR